VDILKRLFFFCCFLISAVPVFVLGSDFLYFLNFIAHQNKQLCEYRQPEAQFLVFINRDTSHVLFENAPRWSESRDENISGKGYFGVELGNFVQPSLQPGDTVHTVFSCFATEEQVVALDVVASIPWQRWPMHLILHHQDLPAAVEDFSLTIDAAGHRHLQWRAQVGVQYDLFRSTVKPLLPNGIDPHIYERIAARLVQSSFIDSTCQTGRHRYILLAREDGILGRHSGPQIDFPEPVSDIQTAVEIGSDTTLALSWFHPDQENVIFRVYRDSVAEVSLLSENGNPSYQQSVELFASYRFQIVAVNTAGNASDPATIQVVAEPPVANLSDLDLLFLSRSPKYPRFSVIYEPSGYNPRIDPSTLNLKHAPIAGELITFTATFQNKGGAAVSAFAIEWSVDSLVVKTENQSGLLAGQKGRSTIQLPWPQTPKSITCRLVGTDDQMTEQNDLLTIRSNALSFHFHVEEPIKKLFDTHLNPVGSYSFEDWSRYHLDYLNRFIREADYPQGEQAVFESVFLDTVSYYQRGELPSGGTHAPDAMLWDGQWGFMGDNDSYDYFKTTVLQNEGGIDWALLHELGHQLGLIDLYNQDVHLHQVQVIEPRTGARIPLTPIVFEVLYYSSRQKALMHSDFRAGFSDHSAGALARNLAKRRGFYGEYLADIPTENLLLVVDPSGIPVADADVWIYQKQDNVVPNKAKFKAKTDAEGIFRFPHRVSPEYHTDLNAENPFSTLYSDAPHVVGTNASLLLRIALPERVAYEFMDICDFNVAYWRGEVDSARYTLAICRWYSIPQTGVGIDSVGDSACRFSFQQNAPNPFNGTTEFRFTLPRNGKTTLSVYNLAGHLVATLVDRHLSAGSHRIQWTTELPSGLYFSVLQSEQITEFRKILLLR